MQLMRSDLDRIPAENMNVPLQEFGRGWFAAEEWHDDRVCRHIPDWYGAGVVVTCRWLAHATVRTETGPWYGASSPITHRTGIIRAEDVDAEAIAAQALDMRRPVPAWLASQPGWLAGILATFDWAWWRTRTSPPIDLPDVKAS